MAKPLPYQIIKGARDLIADRRHWCRWANAQTAKGLHACWASKEARRFCALGALRRASYNLVGDESEAILLSAKVARNLSDMCDRGSIMSTNDWDGHAAILAIFDKYLEKA